MGFYLKLFEVALLLMGCLSSNLEWDIEFLIFVGENKNSQSFEIETVSFIVINGCCAEKTLVDVPESKFELS